MEATVQHDASLDDARFSHLPTSGNATKVAEQLAAQQTCDHPVTAPQFQNTDSNSFNAKQLGRSLLVLH